LFERLLQVPDYRARYTYYLRRAITEYFSPERLFPPLDAVRDMLYPYIQYDTYYGNSYGFTAEDFLKAFDQATDYPHAPYSLKSFIHARRASALQQLEQLNPAPYLYGARSNSPRVGEELAFQVQVQDDEPPAEVLLCYRISAQPENCVPMQDSGNFGDGEANDGQYGLFLPALSAEQSINWYMRAIDNAGATSRLPACGDFQTNLTAGSLTLAINEFMASNDATIADEAGEFDDWLEIHNYGPDPIDLLGLYLSDNPDLPTKWPFPEISIGAGEFLLIWADDDEEQGVLHTNFKLDADGEFIGIFNTDENGNALIDGTEFGIQQTDTALGRIPDGTGAFRSVTPTPGASNRPVSVRGLQVTRLPFKLYPNPGPGPLQLEAPRTGRFRAYISDGMGQQLATYQWQGAHQTIDLKLPAGIYFLRIEEEDQTVFVGKVVRW
ncbi:MAG: T9SS C-terminal target domain-containing protein, partial [Bacteroidetes bacterium]